MKLIKLLNFRVTIILCILALFLIVPYRGSAYVGPPEQASPHAFLNQYVTYNCTYSTANGYVYTYYSVVSYGTDCICPGQLCSYSITSSIISM